MTEVYLGLGANLGDPPASFARALSLLQREGISATARSSLYRSRPVGPQDQPEFFNAVARLETDMAPGQLLALCHHIEQLCGRERLRHWGERTLDLDLLLHGHATLNSEVLTLPHPRLHERAFVLVPLAELAPGLMVPGLDQPVASLLDRCNRDGVWYHGPFED